MSLKSVLVGSFVVLAFAGCAKDSPAGRAADEAGKLNQEAELRSHKYASKCDTTNLLWKLGGVNSSNVVYNFQNGDAGRTIQYFSAADCNQATVIGQATYSGTQTIGGEIPDGSARILDLNYLKVVVTISNQALVDSLNNNPLMPACDHHDWKVGAGMDVTTSAGSATCLLVPKPAQMFDIVHTDGQTTFFGDKNEAGHNGLTPEARPVHLDSGNSFTVFNQ